MWSQSLIIVRYWFNKTKEFDLITNKVGWRHSNSYKLNKKCCISQVNRLTTENKKVKVFTKSVSNLRTGK